MDVLAAVGAGGFLGALGRYELGVAWPTPAGHFPWTTFTINVSGAFALGLVLTLLLERVGPTRYVRPFFCVGVLGAWTTMSTFAVEGDLLVKSGRAAMAIVYVMVAKPQLPGSFAALGIGAVVGVMVSRSNPQ